MEELSGRLQTALGAAYRVERELGGGGMSRVFLAEETRLARRVVVKVLPPELAAEISVDRFNREIQLSASLQHPHIVPLLAAGGEADVLYYTMPFVEGEALRTRLAREGELPVRDAVRILKDVADALAYAHARGIVHRDIKPDNVLLSGNHAVVADFGVAKAVSQAKGQSGLTSVGVALGTPAYMAPEQAAGDPNIDHRADIYAFGAMAYEMLAGRPPFTGLSPHQMLAAHITEPVPPLTDARPSVPPALAELVMRCLEKNPPDRPQTAAEVYQVLESLATTSGSATVTSARATLRHVLRRPRNRFALVTGAVVLALGAWWAFRPAGVAVLDPNRIAIAPFDVLGGSDLSLWREGLVDVLSRSLDGAGPLRTVSPTLIVRRWSGRADAASAQALGRATGARTVVFGGLVGAGADSVRLTATVLDVAAGGPGAEIELREASARMDRLADSLTVRVLRELGRTRAIGLVRSASLGSKSLPAMKAFLQGEQFLRRSEWDSALAYHQRAIGLDSGFALAWSHAGMAAGWQHAANDSLSRTYKLRAGALNHGLAPRESLAVQSESLAAVVYAGPAQIGGRWWTYGRRFIATLDEAVRRYPDDPELWYMLGDATFHAGGLAQKPSRTALDAFDRSIALDSAFTPSYVHAVPLGLDVGGTAAGRRYAKAFLAAGAMGAYAQSTDLIVRLLDPPTRSKAIAYLADSANSHLFLTVWLAVGRWTDSAETVVALVRARVAAEQQATKVSNISTSAAPASLATRGHVREAAQHTTSPSLLAQFAVVGGVAPDSAHHLAQSWATSPGEGALYAAPLLAAAHDTAALAALITRMETVRQHMPPNLPPIARDAFGYVVAATRAFLALARGDSVEALRLFDVRPDTACFGACVIDDLVHVQLLAARGRLADAAARLERPLVGFSPAILPVEVLRGLERGRVNERLGDRERAIAGYSLVVEAWRNADPELRTYVDEARAGLARLGAEKKAS
ncbi:MAG TPA: serine/threonine-protein kinase [Gemmatimonadales bacterium]|jgi:serine/threonine-protein kinase|nr:serine/threonine-protein kinase [Gemmatimonadales bacterium]